MATATEHRALIGGMMVSSASEFIVYGSVRGLVSEHRLVRAAIASAERDRAGCCKQGGYSDVQVYYWDEESGWVQDIGE